MPFLLEYSLVDQDTLEQRLGKTPSVQLPILCAPSGSRPWRPWHHEFPALNKETEARLIVFEIVEAFFYAIESIEHDVVANFISRGLISPDATSASGETPLLAAVRMSSLPMISTLVAHGATVDMIGYAAYSADETLPTISTKSDRHHRMRTPLQLAAENGKLAIVKVLVNDYGADDAILAPDGTLALRLAVINGHRDIVNFLPSRRGGAWVRWKLAHESEMMIVKKVSRKFGNALLFIFWYIPRALVYDVPKFITVKAWKNRYRAARWVKRQTEDLPRKAKEAMVVAKQKVEDLHRRAKKVIVMVPEYAQRLAIKLPHLFKRIFQNLWRIMKAIPGAIKDILLWMMRVLKETREFTINVMERLFSVLHTAFSAVISFFKGITLKDIKDGLVYLARAVIVDGLKMLAGWGKSFWETTKEIVISITGCFGKTVRCLGKLLLAMIIYIPENLWLGAKAVGRSMRQGYSEAMAHVNPKHM